MRFVIVFLALIATAGFAPDAEAGCIPCPEGYSYWHSKEACVPRIAGFYGTPPASTWVDPLPHGYYVGGEDETTKADGPTNDR
jgi:hypothetical protein